MNKWVSTISAAMLAAVPAWADEATPKIPKQYKAADIDLNFIIHSSNFGWLIPGALKFVKEWMT